MSEQSSVVQQSSVGEQSAEWLLMYQKAKESSFPFVKDISPQEVLQRLQDQPDDVLLIDCREDEEQNVSTIAGSISLSQFQFEKVESLPQTCVFFCTIGVRSGFVCQSYMNLYPNVQATFFNLEGSMIGLSHTLEHQPHHKKWLIVPQESSPSKSPSSSSELSSSSPSSPLFHLRRVGPEADSIHVFGETWDLCPSSYKSVFFSQLWQGVVGAKWVMWKWWNIG